ncbi:hypothetical protein, partial [Leisingera sp. F5]|uniref:hypothetical protein n=1 Tax=Leisingera sp. F5 TaxID=1813816 RepID=UPI0025C22602
MRDVENFQIHPLGFFYKTMSSGSVTSRIHIYLEEADFAAQNTWHTHEFDLYSHILAGTLENEIGTFSETGSGDHREYVVEYEGNRSILKPSGRVGEIDKISSFESSPGNRYFISAGQIHRARCKYSPCVTQVEFAHRGMNIFSYGAPEKPFER